MCSLCLLRFVDCGTRFQEWGRWVEGTADKGYSLALPSTSTSDSSTSIFNLFPNIPPSALYLLPRTFTSPPTSYFLVWSYLLPCTSFLSTLHLSSSYLSPYLILPGSTLFRATFYLLHVIFYLLHSTCYLIPCSSLPATFYLAPLALPLPYTSWFYLVWSSVPCVRSREGLEGAYFYLLPKLQPAISLYPLYSTFFLLVPLASTFLFLDLGGDAPHFYLHTLPSTYTLFP